jgi:acyl-CoA synthetase (NDP forming)
VAVRSALAHRDFRARPADPLPAVTPEKAAERQRVALPTRTPGPVDEATGLSLLAAYGIPVVPSRVVETESAAVEAARQIGYPVVLKTAMPQILHKTERGGVHLDLVDESALRGAWRDLATHLGSRALVARMVPRGVEIALGMVRDSQFGALVTVSAGGVLVELLTDRRAALAPFGPATAIRLLDGLALRPLLAGYRGAPAVDIAQLALAISHFSVLAADLAHVVREIDVNPLVCGAEIAAVDALFVNA